MIPSEEQAVNYGEITAARRSGALSIEAREPKQGKPEEGGTDGQIMVMQLALIYDPEMFSRQIEAKLNRLEQRIKDEYRRAESD